MLFKLAFLGKMTSLPDFGLLHFVTEKVWMGGMGQRVIRLKCMINNNIHGERKKKQYLYLIIFKPLTHRVLRFNKTFL